MAYGRMIANAISKDKRINKLCDDTSRLAFTWLVTFADREGRTYGDPAIVRSLLFPRRDDVSIERMAGYISEWHDLGLVIWYEVDDDWYIYFPGFEKNQPNLRKEREAASIMPPPPINSDAITPDEVLTNSGLTPDDCPVKLKEIKLKETEKKEKEVVVVDELEGDNQDLTTATTNYFDIDRSEPLHGINSGQAERAFQKATGMPTFPGTSINSDIKRIQSISQAHGFDWEQTADYLTPYFEGWLKRNYSRTNTAWLDWAVAGEIPRTKQEKVDYAKKQAENQKPGYVNGNLSEFIKH